MPDLSKRRTSGRHRLIPIVLVGLAAWPTLATAQVRAGAHGAWQTQFLDGSFGVGGRVEVDLSFLPGGLTLAGTYDHFFPDCGTCSASDAGLQLLAVPPTPLYLGLGANYRRFSDGQSDDSGDWSVNLIFGIRIRVLPVLWPYAEYRQQIGSESINEQTVSVGLVLSPARARNAPRRRSAR
ncbi:MAG: hypothetical protein F4187_08280 [Gemmatimonadetes bacterium]|nr:hypothetical protein [Gemmatimonadota bacterium]